MKSALHSSVIVSALYAGDPDHDACRKVLLASRHSVLVHAFAETFSTLTGGRLGFRVPASVAAVSMGSVPGLTRMMRCFRSLLSWAAALIETPLQAMYSCAVEARR